MKQKKFRNKKKKFISQELCSPTLNVLAWKQNESTPQYAEMRSKNTTPNFANNSKKKIQRTANVEKWRTPNFQEKKIQRILPTFFFSKDGKRKSQKRLKLKAELFTVSTKILSTFVRGSKTKTVFIQTSKKNFTYVSHLFSNGQKGEKPRKKIICRNKLCKHNPAECRTHISNENKRRKTMSSSVDQNKVIPSKFNSLS